MRYTLTVKDVFAAAHRVVGSGGKCESMHGHNFQVAVTVSGTRLGDAGMLIDFGDLKKALREVTGLLDHTDLNELPGFAGMSPSSENIARFVAERISPVLDGKGVDVDSVTVWESDTASATYEP